MSVAIALKMEAESKGFARFFDLLWLALGFSHNEFLAGLNKRADEIRQRWMGATEDQKRFANWVACKLAN